MLNTQHTNKQNQLLKTWKQTKQADKQTHMEASKHTQTSNQTKQQI